MIKEIHIFDIDGTLVDSSHRYRARHNGERLTIDLQHWIDNQHLHVRDSLLPLADEYKRLNNTSGIYTIWITARNETHFKDSFFKLIRKLGIPNKWFYRPDGSSESGATLKAKQLKAFLSLKQFSKARRFFYEDNKAYLAAVCPAINAEPIYIESNQGH